MVDVANEMSQTCWRMSCDASKKINYVATIASLHKKPNHLFLLCIPLFKIVAMPMVKPTLACDLVKHKHEFIHDYHTGATIFYVSLTSEAREALEFSSEEMRARAHFRQNKNFIHHWIQYQI